MVCVRDRDENAKVWSAHCRARTWSPTSVRSFLTPRMSSDNFASLVRIVPPSPFRAFPRLSVWTLRTSERGKFEGSDTAVRVWAAHYRHHHLVTLDYGICDGFLWVSASNISVSGHRGVGVGVGGMTWRWSTDRRALRVTTRRACGDSTHAASHMRRCLTGCHSHRLPLIISQGLSAGRSWVDSCVVSGIPL